MSRPERVIGIATHSNFLLALYHACLDGAPDTPQVFHTGELRALTVSSREHTSPRFFRPIPILHEASLGKDAADEQAPAAKRPRRP